jgi:hypothetical protein
VRYYLHRCLHDPARSSGPGCGSERDRRTALYRRKPGAPHSSDQPAACGQSSPILLIGDLDLDPHAFRLYCHLRRLTGKPPDGACWHSTATLTAACRRSTGKVSQSKHRLLQAGLIHIEKRPGPGCLHDHITLIHIWSAKDSHFAPTPAPSPDERPTGERVHSAGIPVHPVNPSPSPGEPSTAKCVHSAGFRVHPVNPLPSPGESPAKCVHSAGVPVHQVSALRSPGETIHIPYKQISSSRKDEDDDDEEVREKPHRRNPLGARAVADAEPSQTRQSSHATSGSRPFHARWAGDRARSRLSSART